MDSQCCTSQIALNELYLVHMNHFSQQLESYQLSQRHLATSRVQKEAGRYSAFRSRETHLLISRASNRDRGMRGPLGDRLSRFLIQVLVTPVCSLCKNSLSYSIGFVDFPVHMLHFNKKFTKTKTKNSKELFVTDIWLSICKVYTEKIGTEQKLNLSSFI